VALAGLLGMVWGEQLAVRFLVKPPVSSDAGAVTVPASYGKGDPSH
jgi:hypothetical protein